MTKFYLRDQFDSKARLITIKQFHFGQHEYDSLTTEFPDIEKSAWVDEPGYFPDMPCIIQSDGYPWEIGNAFLVSQLQNIQPYEMASLKVKAKHLLHYLRFLESTGKHYLEFPQLERKRVTWLFRAKIEDCVQKGLSASYAKAIISTVVNFYRHIIAFGFISDSEIENAPFKDVDKRVKFHDKLGFTNIKTVLSSNLAIPARRNTNPEVGVILDGGKLRPLTLEEQLTIVWAFNEGLCSNTLELMMLTALTTGAREQSVCTLRVGHILEAYGKVKELEAAGNETKKGITIFAGAGHQIDTKYGKRHRLEFPIPLIKRLYIYATSDDHVRKMSKGFYKNTPENYLFLTAQGSPYYTSKSELIDRQDPNSHWSINAPIDSVRDGDSLRSLLNDFIRRIRTSGREINRFKFHDLRATFGMNIVRDMSARGFKSAKVLSEVKSKLGHSNITSTQRYLDFDQLIESYANATNAFEEHLLEGLES